MVILENVNVTVSEKISNDGPVTTILFGGVMDCVKLSVIVVVGGPNPIDSVRERLTLTVCRLSWVKVLVFVNVNIRSLTTMTLVMEMVTVVPGRNVVETDVLTVIDTVPVIVLIDVSVWVVVVLLTD